MGKIKEFITDHITDIITISALVAFMLGCWILYTANRTTNEYHDVNDTVQQAQNYNRDARGEIKSASAEIDNTQKQLDNSVKRTGEITNRVNNAKKRVDGNAEIARECEDIIDAGRRDTAEARNIFRDIDERNKVNGTQTDNRA